MRHDSHEQLQPGDLIFAEGKYVKEGAKPQKGDSVHVEVFLGGGPAGKSVCGARWGRGVVQVPPHPRCPYALCKDSGTLQRSDRDPLP